VSKLEDLDELSSGEVEHVHFHDVPRAMPRELIADADRIPPGMGVIPLRKGGMR
jgi:sugar phosphate isomerase/epimerase